MPGCGAPPYGAAEGDPALRRREAYGPGIGVAPAGCRHVQGAPLGQFHGARFALQRDASSRSVAVDAGLHGSGALAPLCQDAGLAGHHDVARGGEPQLAGGDLDERRVEDRLAVAPEQRGAVGVQHRFGVSYRDGGARDFQAPPGGDGAARGPAVPLDADSATRSQRDVCRGVGERDVAGDRAVLVVPVVRGGHPRGREHQVASGLECPGPLEDQIVGTMQRHFAEAVEDDVPVPAQSARCDDDLSGLQRE